MNRLLIRVDGSVRMGVGHVMRCLALAQAWQDAGGSVVFASAECPPLLVERLLSEGADMARVEAEPGSSADARATVLMAATESARWVVADGYHFGADYQRAIKAGGLSLLCIDDYGHAEHYCADLVLNQNIYAREDIYPSREPTTRLLLGVRYALLRREFRRWNGWQREFPEVARRVLVTMGGSDADNVTLKVLQSLELVEAARLQVKAVIGTGNPNHEALASHAAGASLDITLAKAVTDIAEEMAWADVAVSAAGSTCWELAFMSLPSCLVVLAENQLPVGEWLHERGIAVNAGWFHSVDPPRLSRAVGELISDRAGRQEMSRRGRLAVDGQGPQRIVGALMER